MPAYALRAEFKDTYAGGTLNAGINGESLDTLAALEEGAGVIVVDDDDSYSVDALDQAPAFKRVAVPQAVKKDPTKVVAPSGGDDKKER